MRNNFLLFTMLVLLFANSAYAADRVYTFIQPSEFDSSVYGFSGTITTDGSLGTFSDLSFIKDWSLTMITPAEIDGVSVETRTSADSAFDLSVASLISVTESDISLPNSGGADSYFFQITDSGGVPSELYLTFRGPNSNFLGSVFMVDASETPPFVVPFGNSNELPIATGGVAVPEPSAGVLRALASIGLLLRWRRQS